MNLVPIAGIKSAGQCTHAVADDVREAEVSNDELEI